MNDRYYAEGTVPETPDPSSRPDAWDETEVVGTHRPRVDAYERVSGTAEYPSDLILPGMLHGAVLRCPLPHARIRGVDSSRAERLPGVRAVLTPDSAEVRGLTWRYSGEVSTDLLDTECRHEGEAVAAVAADTPYAARDALESIEVDYEELTFVVDEHRALEPSAPAIHPGGNRVGETQAYDRGDLEAGLSEADVVLEEEFRTACEIHTPLELHGCVARWDGDRLTLWESTQGVYAVQSRVARVLGLPLAKVRVIGHYMGGGFGSKLQASKYSILAALLARKTARPVKLFLSREETYVCVGNRPPTTLKLRGGVRNDGTLTGLELSVIGTGGAYPAGGTSLADWLIRDLYLCPNVRTESTDVYINAGPSRPFRAPGHPQGAWALEQLVDSLAESISMDPVELRLKNIPAFSQGREGNPPYTTDGLRRCIEEGARAFGWAEARAREPGTGRYRRGVGMAASLWIAGAGGPPSTVIVKLFADGSANLNMGASDIGTGTKTVMALVVAEELGIAPDRIQIENADTGTTQYATPSGGSKTVPTEAPATRDAALAVREKLLEMAAEELEISATELEIVDGVVRSTDGSHEKPVTELEGLQRRGVVVGVGHRGPNPEDKAVCPFAAQFCEVEVDVETGEVRILRFLGAHDSGRVMDRLTYDNQVFGGITMGIGLAATEERTLDRATGKMVNRNWHDYKLPTMLDVPSEMISHPIDLPDPEANTTGAKGLGEPVTIPTAAAVANAIHHAVGIRVTETPITPMRLSRLLAQQRARE